MATRKKPALLAQGKPRTLGGSARPWRVRLYAPEDGGTRCQLDTGPELFKISRRLYTTINDLRRFIREQRWASAICSHGPDVDVSQRDTPSARSPEKVVYEVTKT